MEEEEIEHGKRWAAFAGELYAKWLIAEAELAKRGIDLFNLVKEAEDRLSGVLVHDFYKSHPMKPAMPLYDPMPPPKYDQSRWGRFADIFRRARLWKR